MSKQSVSKHWRFCVLRRFASAALVLITLVACQSVVKPSWAIPEGVSTQSVNGYPMAYTTRGTGPTVVLVHGVLNDYRYWQSALDTWSSDYRVMAVSLRHFYPEPWTGKGNDFSVHQHAKDLADFISTLGGPVHLVGWSYGGHVAYELARARPDLVKKLVLAEAPLDALVGPADQAANAVQVQRAAETAKLFSSEGLDQGLSFAVDSIAGPGAWSRVPAASRQGFRDNAWTVVAIGLSEPERVTCTEFGMLKMPVLLVTGELTTTRNKQLVAAEAKCLPQASLSTIPKAGHSMARANPAAFKDAVLMFLR